MPVSARLFFCEWSHNDAGVGARGGGGGGGGGAGERGFGLILSLPLCWPRETDSGIDAPGHDG